MIGLGFNEVTTFTISNENDEFTKIGLDKGKEAQIENPIGDEYSCIRVGLIPSILKILNENRHHSLPQQIFELGVVVDDNFENRHHLAFVKIDAKANFTECKSILEAVMRDSGSKYKIEENSHPGFVKGRCSSVIFNNKKVGFFGELHPRTISEFDLEHPVIAMEIQADMLRQ